MVRTPLATAPHCKIEPISASVDINEDYKPIEKPLWSPDPMNLALVVETTNHSVRIDAVR